MTEELKQKWLSLLGSLHVELQDGTTPAQWIEQGYNPTEHRAWFKAGGFDPSRVKELESEGFTPGDVARRVNDNELDDEKIESGLSIAYMYCNGDLSIEDVHRLIN